MPMPSKISDTVVSSIVAGVQSGLCLAALAGEAGVSERTLRDWIRRGEQDLAEGDQGTLHAKLALGCAASHAHLQRRLLDVILREAESGKPGSWRPAYSLLKSKFSNFQGKPARPIVDVSQVVITSQSARQFSEEDRLKLYHRACREAGVTPMLPSPQDADDMIQLPDGTWIANVCVWEQAMQREQEILDSIDFSDLV